MEFSAGTTTAIVSAAGEQALYAWMPWIHPSRVLHPLLYPDEVVSSLMHHSAWSLYEFLGSGLQLACSCLYSGHRVMPMSDF